MSKPATVDASEVARFSALAEQWWDPDGSFRPLHKINPVRVRYVRDALAAQTGRAVTYIAPLAELAILDVAIIGFVPFAFHMSGLLPRNNKTKAYL